MFSTTAFPKPDPARPTPPAPVGARSWADDPPAAAADGPPTLRVPVRAPAVDADPLAVTPPPTADLRFPISDWSSDVDEDAPAKRGPRVGDTVLGFKLVGELGRGAFARVYLAHQESLAGRQVALKVTFRPTREAERLARLQHTNVVPVYSVHEEGAAQIICMPYLGRTTVADLIRAYRVDHPSRHSGRKSTSARAGRSTALDSGKSRPSSAPRSDGRSDRAPVWEWGDENPPPVIGDPLAVLEMLGQMADGLSHAHARGILHLDLKPANVLFADTGEPMLFDFNLSFDANRPERDLVGGTMPYMAIEQLLDMRSRGSGVIDGRADLYAMGVMAFEMLTGAVPFPHAPGRARDIDGMVAARRAGPPPLRPLNSLVTPAVEAIVRKLLAAEPEDRYQTADDLRIDIARHLADLPLRFAREASVRERVGKWRRRNPRLPLKILAACLIGLTLGLGAVAHERSQDTARGAAVEQARATRAAIDSTRLDLILPEDPKARERGIARATAILATYGLPADRDWRTRQSVRMLPAAERGALTEDLGELLFLLARVQWQAGAAKPEAERRAAAAEAWKLNEQARGCFAGAVPAAVNRQAVAIAPVAGESFDAPATELSADPRHLFLDAVDSLGRGYYAAAVPQLDKAVAAQPGHAAAQFALAYCRQHLGQHARAIERYDVARAMLPTDPRPAHYRGLIYGLTKKPALAESEFTAALELAPDYAEAYRHRALARYRIGTKEKLAGAETDLTAALDKGASPLFVYAVREQVRKARGDENGAQADRAAAGRIDPQTEQDYFVRGWSRMKTDSKGALADLRKASEINPRSLVALQNQAHVLADGLKDQDAALAVATKVAELYPEYAPALTGRAVVLARLGKREDAHKEIAKARLLSEDAEVLYHAACVYSLTSGQNPGDRTEAVNLLRRAFRDGYSDLRGLGDSDLNPIRGLPEFKEIEQSIRVMLR